MNKLYNLKFVILLKVLVDNLHNYCNKDMYQTQYYSDNSMFYIR